MDSPEQEPKPEFVNLAEQLSPEYKLHALRFLQVLPNLSNLTIQAPIDSLEIQQWIFPVVDYCHGVAVDIGSNDYRWITCYGAGMPKDMPPVDVCFSATALHRKYKDFAYHGKGVLADPANLTKGASGWRWTYTHPQTKEVFTVHLWYLVLFLRQSATSLLTYYNQGDNELFNSISRKGKGIVGLQVVNVSPNDLQSAHTLINHHFLLHNFEVAIDAATKRGDMMPNDVFVPAARLAVEALAKERKPLNKTSLADKMVLDRDTLRKYLSRRENQSLWVQLQNSILHTS